MLGGLPGAAQAVTLNGPDLEFILHQIKRSEAHAGGGTLLGSGPNQVANPLLPYGLRTVNGELNNLNAGREKFGAAEAAAMLPVMKATRRVNVRWLSVPAR